ncbi:MAG: IclR family transcriptional regulator [Candidatus Nanopelagicales bacterium]
MRPTNSVDRVADALEALASNGRPLSVTELATKLGVHKATASRLMATMARRGLVRRNSAGYLLGPALARLAAIAVAELELVDLSRPILRELVEVTGEASYLSVPYRGAVLYVEQVTPHGARMNNDWTGRMGPLHCSSSGKVFAAFGAIDDLGTQLSDPLPLLASRTINSPEAFRRVLPRVRRQGYATSSDEAEDGMTSVAAPVMGSEGEVLAALGVGVATARCSHQRLSQLGAATIGAAAALARRLGPPRALVTQPIPAGH